MRNLSIRIGLIYSIPNDNSSLNEDERSKLSLCDDPNDYLPLYNRGEHYAITYDLIDGVIKKNLSKDGKMLEEAPILEEKLKDIVSLLDATFNQHVYYKVSFKSKKHDLITFFQNRTPQANYNNKIIMPSKEVLTAYLFELIPKDNKINGSEDGLLKMLLGTAKKYGNFETRYKKCNDKLVKYNTFKLSEQDKRNVYQFISKLSNNISNILRAKNTSLVPLISKNLLKNYNTYWALRIYNDTGYDQIKRFYLNGNPIKEKNYLDSFTDRNAKSAISPSIGMMLTALDDYDDNINLSNIICPFSVLFFDKCVNSAGSNNYFLLEVYNKHKLDERAEYAKTKGLERATLDSIINEVINFNDIKVIQSQANTQDGNDNYPFKVPSIPEINISTVIRNTINPTKIKMPPVNNFDDKMRDESSKTLKLKTEVITNLVQKIDRVIKDSFIKFDSN